MDIFSECATECQRAWVDSAGDHPTVPRRTISDRKVLAIVASNYTKSLVYVEILHDGGSINADWYLKFLQNMLAEFQGRVPPWEIILQHDNARPHVAHQIREWVEDQHMTLLHQAPYSPDTNLMDRFLFRNYESYRRVQDFANSQEVSENLQDFMNAQTAAKLSKEFENLKVHLQNIIQGGGDYV